MTHRIDPVDPNNAGQQPQSANSTGKQPEIADPNHICGPHCDEPSADVSVKKAVVTDAQRIGHIHCDAMTRMIATYAPESAGVAQGEGVDPQTIGAQWLYSISEPPTPAHQVLSAFERDRIVGFAAFAPIEADAHTLEIVALEVDPDYRNQGHGSRLLNACADKARELAATSLQVWISPDDEQRIRFYQDAGFGPKGQQRAFAIGDARVDEHLWYAVFD